jgi:thiol:disulfide interchange protein DsbA
LTPGNSPKPTTPSAVVSKAKRADQMVQAYKIQGVPAMTVDGKYLVTGKETQGAWLICRRLPTR